MKIALIPDDEEDRLAALAEYQILDTATEAIFDSITHVASSICNTPISTLSLIDRHRQWLKSSVGLDNASDTSRDISFCAHTILDSDLMEVPDATLDERFFDNPLVLNPPSIRFYAGMPLINSQGYKLGALCVIDSKPRVLDEAQKNVLKNLSDIVIKILEIRKGILSDINQRKMAAEELVIANAKLQIKLLEQNQSNHELVLLSEMSVVLQACVTVEEVYQAIIKYGSTLFPGSIGILYRQDGSQDMTAVSGWGAQTISAKTFPQDACRALRHGQFHAAGKHDNDLICQHFHNEKLSDSLCMLLVTKTRITGLFSIAYPASHERYRISETHRLLAIAMSEQIELALANAEGRETLHQLSIRDVLTGLYNRRYLTGLLKEELHSIEKKQGQMAFIMVDIDFFKHVNDKFGHDAGDKVLVETAKLLTASLEPEGQACRFGGEEFVVVLKNITLAATTAWAEKLRRTIECKTIQHNDITLDKITFSIGIAMFPEHGQDVNQLLVAADMALYQAKRAGRNQVVVCAKGVGMDSSTPATKPG